MATLKVRAGDVVGYDDVGRGPVVMLVHGSPGTSRAWQPVAERLASRFRVISPNLPGYGATSPPPDGGPGDSSYAAALIEALGAEVGQPVVLAGHSYGGAVALVTALRGTLTPAALALFEPVAVPVLAAVGDDAAFADTQAMFADYRGAVEAGDPQAVRKMVDYWFGVGTFDRMPAPTREFLIAHTAHNIRDVHATFRDPYSVEALRRLAMPVLVACGSRSPEIMARICGAIATHVPRGRLETIEKANHALTSTHVDAVAALIAGLADGSA
jgi:pimeloyl-ACP methyl ester carboxylesterase